MLPAIVFVFSRKHVEQCAHEITVPLLEDDSKVGYIVRRECEQIVRRLPNCHEYLELPEYNELVGLLEKGIGIHHSGMIPILREIVELMISKKYIKVLFATESFAIGLDCPIKTPVFSALKKFDGRTDRPLHSHEYTQMAGRAGRRGIDTIGYVVHCNNLFDVPSVLDYKAMLSGKPQALISKFRIHYSLILNLLKRNGQADVDYLVDFTKNSMIQNELVSASSSQIKTITDMESIVGDKSDKLSKSLRSPIHECNKYILLEAQVKTAVNKKRKDIEREMAKMTEEFRYLKQDIVLVRELDTTKDDLDRAKGQLEYLSSYLHKQVEHVCAILLERGFINMVDAENHIAFDLTIKGQLASSIAEIHPLVFADVYEKWSGFSEWSVDQIIGLITSFTDIKVAEEFRRDRPNCQDGFIKRRLEEMVDLYRDYEDFEIDRHMETGIDYQNSLNFDITDFVLQWIDCTTEQECKYFIQQVISEKGISVGDYSKAMMKIGAVAKEWANVCEIMGNVELLHKLSHVDEKILKYVTTSQSLYV